jgi:hypothetical protein
MRENGANGIKGSSYLDQDGKCTITAEPSECYIFEDEDVRMQFKGLLKPEGGWKKACGAQESFFKRNSCFLNPDQTGGDVYKGVMDTSAAANAAHSVWAGKATPNLNETYYLALRDLDAKMVASQRQNILDKLICEVNCCFNQSREGRKEVGFPVEVGTGKKHILKEGEINCHSTSLDGSLVKTQAYLNPTSLVKELKIIRKKSKVMHQVLVDNNVTTAPRHVTYEALTAFEHGDLDTSAHEWFMFLEHLGHPFASVEAAKKALKRTGMVNTRPPPSSHKSKLVNFDEVQKTLAEFGDEEFINLLRLD